MPIPFDIYDFFCTIIIVVNSVSKISYNLLFVHFYFRPYILLNLYFCCWFFWISVLFCYLMYFSLFLTSMSIYVQLDDERKAPISCCDDDLNYLTVETCFYWLSIYGIVRLLLVFSYNYIQVIDFISDLTHAHVCARAYNFIYYFPFYTSLFQQIAFSFSQFLRIHGARITYRHNILCMKHVRHRVQ